MGGLLAHLVSFSLNCFPIPVHAVMINILVVSCYSISVNKLSGFLV